VSAVTDDILKLLSAMIVGNPSRFAIQSELTTAYPNRGQLGLGSFVVHISGKKYGVDSPDATLLACSYDEVCERLQMRGKHAAPFANEPDGQALAQTCYDIRYKETDLDTERFGLTYAEFEEKAHDNHIRWAPDGDEAFDDGSFILQFDLDSRVRLIAFRVDDSGIVDQSSFADCWVTDTEYYSVLETWSKAFMAEWQPSPKASV
jgi:hypothetical protein